MKKIILDQSQLDLITINIPLDTKIWSKSEVSLEIGCGNGDFILQLAQTFPDQIFIGCEIKKDRYLKTAKKILQAKLTNVYLFLGDGLILLNNIPDTSLNSFYMNFPDPWPKKRHHKRRFFYLQDTLTLLCQKLKIQGNIYFASDHEEYFFFMLRERLEKNTSLKTLFPDGYTHSLENYFTTHYEKKWKNKNRSLFYTKFTKIA